jgi:hypothetical protein
MHISICLTHARVLCRSGSLTVAMEDMKVDDAKRRELIGIVHSLSKGYASMSLLSAHVRIRVSCTAPVFRHTHLTEWLSGAVTGLLANACNHT